MKFKGSEILEILEKILYVVGLILLFLFIIRGLFSRGYKKRVNKSINLLKKNQGDGTNNTISMKDLNKLPLNVRRWLIRSGVLGKEMPSYAYIEQKGEMRLDSESDKWIFASSKQFAGIKMPGFVWQVKAAFIPFINMYGMDSFVDGSGSLEMRLFNLVRLVNVKDTVKVNQSSLARYLLELPWYPQAALNKNMKWEEVDEYKARLVMSHRGIVGQVYIYFNKDYDVIKTSSMRYKDTDDSGELLECIGESKDFEVFDGIRIPSKIHITWILPQGDYTWYKLKVEKLTYK